MNDDKKSATLGPIRVNECTVKEYYNALEHYNISRPEFSRMCIEALIQSHQAGREIELPVVFLLGPTRDARRAAEALGIDIARFREELAKDIIEIAARGDRIALPGHILTEREQKILSGSKPQPKRKDTAVPRIWPTP
jgi:hypothetical protein